MEYFARKFFSAYLFSIFCGEGGRGVPRKWHLACSPSCQLLKPYRSASMHSSSTAREGRVTLSGRVARGWSVMLIMSMKLGAVVFK
jgi:hypothetical protein